MKELDDIRALVDPQGYVESMQQARGILLRNLGLVLVDYDLTAVSPHLSAEERAGAEEEFLHRMEDIKWRIEEIDKRIIAITNPTAPTTINRAERRRKR